MRFIIRKLVFVALLLGGFGAQAQHNVRVVRFPELQKLLKSKQDTLLVINFWATWCKPCVRELPHFQKAYDGFKEKPVRFLLVSLDDAKELKTRLEPFVQRHNMTTPVWLLNESDYNSFIDKVDESWQGSLPATLFLNNHREQRVFHEKELTEAQLNQTIRNLLPN
ncbi:AhpC/TSA family protein [Flexibacter flexilis DSM 6793]|uniref:AhpC/TSA family protein n=1 Tax=Flexibacter flexilis DSM 6793 TaxID=927664 RepID=A0A1I1JZT2_9BACT|nr:TlpA disulfide reductase family protein [Flexibacter flexilis]SFC51263.1 AhpC/TSA family protein [Flexibacter flexilis DSM 6793]